MAEINETDINNLESYISFLWEKFPQKALYKNRFFLYYYFKDVAFSLKDKIVNWAYPSTEKGVISEPKKISDEEKLRIETDELAKVLLNHARPLNESITYAIDYAGPLYESFKKWFLDPLVKWTKSNKGINQIFGGYVSSMVTFDSTYLFLIIVDVVKNIIKKTKQSFTETFDDMWVLTRLGFSGEEAENVINILGKFCSRNLLMKIVELDKKEFKSKTFQVKLSDSISDESSVIIFLAHDIVEKMLVSKQRQIENEKSNNEKKLNTLEQLLPSLKEKISKFTIFRIK